MKTVIAAALLLGTGIFAVQHPQDVPVLEGKDHPILLKRMVVTATPLPR